MLASPPGGQAFSFGMEASRVETSRGHWEGPLQFNAGQADEKCIGVGYRKKCGENDGKLALFFLNQSPPVHEPHSGVNVARAHLKKKRAGDCERARF